MSVARVKVSYPRFVPESADELAREYARLKGALFSWEYFGLGIMIGLTLASGIVLVWILFL